MFNSFSKIIEQVKKNKSVKMSVAVAQDKEVLLCIKSAWEQGIAQSILVGDRQQIEPMAQEIGLPEDIRIIHEPDVRQAALMAVSLVHNGEAKVLFKGFLNTTDYLKAVLDSEVGLRTERILSHLAVYEVPGFEKMLFATDTGMNIDPSLEEKKGILVNALDVMNAIGIDNPNVAILAANELVNPKMKCTVDAMELANMYKEDSLFKGIIEGPVAMDVVASAEAAQHKGINSKIAGNVDLLIFPDVNSGNIWSKAMTFYANYKMAGIILGATNPIVLVSRSDNSETKLNSIAFACYVAAHQSYSKSAYNADKANHFLEGSE